MSLSKADEYSVLAFKGTASLDQMGSHSLAAVFRAVGQPLTVERFSLPELAGKDALARVRCATICGSDLHSYFGRRHSPVPAVLGHEMVGEIVAMGATGTRDYDGVPLQPGDRVTWSMVWSCGHCFYCSRGLQPKCERLMKFGHEAIVPGRALMGGMAEYCHLPEGTAIFRVPPNLPDVVASPSNCATATVAAVLRHAGSVEGEVVVIHGAGMLGLTACAMTASAGAAQVVVLEPDPRRRERALQFGALLALDSASAPRDIADRVKELTAGRGADAGLELSGYPDSFELGVGLLRPGGRFVLAGATFPSRPAQLPAEQLVRRMIRTAGVYNYTPRDLKTALGFLAGAVDRYPLAELVAASYPLREVNAAIAFAEKERPPRVALIP
jgi:alcohol dehydrogenase